MRVLFMLFVGLVTGCQGATILTVNLGNVSGLPGDVLNIFGTLTNNTGNTVTINLDSFTLSGFPPGSVDDLPFFSGPATLGPSEVSSSFQFMKVTVPNSQAPAIYDGTFDVLGDPNGIDPNAQDFLGEGAFTVEVQNSIPEPASWMLLAGGLVLVGLWRRRRNPV
jgi:hypothetical protein